MMKATDYQEVLAKLEESTLVPRRASAKQTMQDTNWATPRLINPLQALDSIEGSALMLVNRRREGTSSG